MNLVTEETILGQLMMKYPEAVEVLVKIWRACYRLQHPGF